MILADKPAAYWPRNEYSHVVIVKTGKVVRVYVDGKLA